MVLVARMASGADAADALIASAIARGVFPAASAEVGRSAGVLWRQAFGTLTFDPESPATDDATIFDLASLTKPLAATSVALSLAAEGSLRLHDRVADYAPEWRGPDRDDVTIQQLLEHASGLSARLPGGPPADRREFEHDICTMPLEYRPGSRSIYSDLGFILLATCLERSGRATLAVQSARVLDVIVDAVAPGDHAARLLVEVPRESRAITAPTRPLAEDVRRGRMLRGEVHDNYAAALGGFSGHAGLFGTAAGVGVVARGLLRAARGDTSLPSPLSPALIRRAFARSSVPGSSRALGWDTMLPASSCGTRLTASSVGHVGFTGTSLWIDPEHDRYFVLLTNRVCDGGTSEQMQQVRRTFHDTLAEL
jgi:CubicO group peptidase (beta-lactamase class C family)